MKKKIKELIQGLDEDEEYCQARLNESQEEGNFPAEQLVDYPEYWVGRITEIDLGRKALYSLLKEV